MTDIFSQNKRSDIMSNIGNKDTKPELRIRSLLHQMGYRFRLHRKDLPGKPDIVLPKYKTVIFIHGCYWHRHTCKKGRSTPTSNREFWEEKFSKNIERDKRNLVELKNIGWNIITIWQCELKNMEKIQSRLKSHLK